VERGKNKERELMQSDELAAGLPAMEWLQVYLLSLPSMLSASLPGSTSLIVDKSTSDAIACGLQVRLGSLGAALDSPDAKEGKKTDSDLPCISPLHILALNLAVVASPGARWLTLSYSKDRYPFLLKLFDPQHDKLPYGVPDPAWYWKLIRKHEIQTEQEVSERFREHFGIVHRPTTSHYVYVLERTEVKLEVSEVEKLDVRVEKR
jgi:hypothetical protein